MSVEMSIEPPLPHHLSIADLQSIFDFSDADLLANRRGHYSGAQHRLRGAALALLAIALLVVLSLPIQCEIGLVLGWVAAPCFAGAGAIGLLAGFAGLAAVWNTLRESVTTPVVKYSGFVKLLQQGDQYFLQSDDFSISIEPDRAEQFIEGHYDVYYVPNYVADRARLFSIEPALS